MTTPRRAPAALLSLLFAGPVLLTGCGEAGTSAAGASSSVSAGSSTSSAATETTTAPTSEAPDFPADTSADTEKASADARVTVRDIRTGAHDGFDRVVFEVGGAGTPGWDVRYVDVASSQGSGEPVTVAGDAVLQVTLTGAGYPYDTGVEEVTRGSVTGAGTSTVTEVVFDATFEGRSVAFVGTTAQQPFRVYSLADPTRVVLEIAHAAS